MYYDVFNQRPPLVSSGPGEGKCSSIAVPFDVLPRHLLDSELITMMYSFIYLCIPNQ